MAAVMLLWQAWYQSLADKLPWQQDMFPQRACQLKAGVWLSDPNLDSSLAAAWTQLAHICPQGLGCHRPYAELQLTFHFCMGMLQEAIRYIYPHIPHPAFFTDTYPLTKITIKKPPREIYFWEPVLLTCCRCETYIINKSYVTGNFFTIVRPVRGSIIWIIWKQHI